LIKDDAIFRSNSVVPQLAVFLFRLGKPGGVSREDTSTNSYYDYTVKKDVVVSTGESGAVWTRLAMKKSGKSCLVGSLRLLVARLSHQPGSQSQISGLGVLIGRRVSSQPDHPPNFEDLWRKGKKSKLTKP
jgi:hypothetical protein